MDVIVCTAGVGNALRTSVCTSPTVLEAEVLWSGLDVILVKQILTNTSHVTSCIVMLKEVIKVSLLQKGKNDRIKNIVSVFYGIQCSLNNYELNATTMNTDIYAFFTSGTVL
jgi:hypothetical protein